MHARTHAQITHIYAQTNILSNALRQAQKHILNTHLHHSKSNFSYPHQTSFSLTPSLSVSVSPESHCIHLDKYFRLEKLDRSSITMRQCKPWEILQSDWETELAMEPAVVMAVASCGRR